MNRLAPWCSVVFACALPLSATSANFVSLTPTSGSVVTTPSVTFSGTTDSSGATVSIQNENTGFLATTRVDATRHTFSYTIPLALGMNTLDVTVLNAARHGAAMKVVNILYQPDEPVLSMLMPETGATISDNVVQVSGAFDGPDNTGIAINGVVAAREGRNFSAQVPLVKGINHLAVRATLPSGQVLTRTLDVTGSDPDPIQVTTSPSDGLAPLTVNFGIQNSGPNPITRIEVDFNGDGVTDFSGVDAGVPLSHTYSGAGAYQAHFRLTDSQGHVIDKTVTVMAQDPAKLDQMLQTQWRGMTGAMRRGEPEQALSYFTADTQTQYAPLFSKLQSTLPAIGTALATPQLSQLSRTVGEYGVKRTLSNGKTALYLVYFQLDPNGVWKIDSM